MNYSCVDVRPERSSFENHTDERLDAWTASNVRRGDLVREAKDQSFRYRKDLGLPNQVCLFRRSFITLWRRAGNKRRRSRPVAAHGARASPLTGSFLPVANIFVGVNRDEWRLEMIDQIIYECSGASRLVPLPGIVDKEVSRGQYCVR